jgi:ABC-2 type transport system permease protein
MASRGATATPFPITDLTLRQFASGKAIRVVGLFAIVPVIFAGIFLIGSDATSSVDFLDDLFENVIAPTILPLAILVLATNALGNELEDRTMVYLVLKPLSRLRIVMEKFAAVVATSTLLLWIGTLLSFIVALRGDSFDNLRMLVAMLIAVFFAVIAYGALFIAVSLLISRALLAGILYSLLWETTFGRFIPGIRLISVRHYVQSIYFRVFDNPQATLSEPMHLFPAIVTLLVLVVLSLAIATWRLRSMNFE